MIFSLQSVTSKKCSIFAHDDELKFNYLNVRNDILYMLLVYLKYLNWITSSPRQSTAYFIFVLNSYSLPVPAQSPETNYLRVTVAVVGTAVKNYWYHAKIVNYVVEK